MKILLLQPPIEDYYHTKERLQPLGLAYVKAALKKYLSQVDVKIVDCHHHHSRRTIPVPTELSDVGHYFSVSDKSPFSSFHHYYHFGLSFEDIAKMVAEHKPDLVGISALFTPYYREVLKTAEAIKNIYKVPIVVGGAHASCHPLSLIENPNIDFVICGEGENPMVELIKALIVEPNTQQKSFSQVPNLVYKKEEKIIFNPRKANYSINDLPLPDMSDFSSNDYLYNGLPLITLIASRGCPHTCSFCSVQQTFGYKYRRRKNQSILDEMKLRYKAGYRVFDFEDDNLTLEMKKFQELCILITQEFSQKDILLTAMNGISYAHLDATTLSLMKEAGFEQINIALVSAKKNTLEALRRGHTFDSFSHIVAQATSLGLNVLSSQILGLPQEILNDMIEGLICTTRLPVLIGVSPFYLTPSSPIACEIKKTFTPQDLVRARLTAMGADLSSVTRPKVYTLFVTARIINFLKSLSLPSGVECLSIDSVFQLPSTTEREKIGKDILLKLFHSGILYAWTGTQFVPLTNFCTEIFMDLWKKVGWVQTQKDKKLIVDEQQTRF